jgi:hypothetical protein
MVENNDDQEIAVGDAENIPPQESGGMVGLMNYIEDFINQVESWRRSHHAHYSQHQVQVRRVREATD